MGKTIEHNQIVCEFEDFVCSGHTSICSSLTRCGSHQGEIHRCAKTNCSQFSWQDRCRNNEWLPSEWTTAKDESTFHDDQSQRVRTQPSYSVKRKLNCQRFSFSQYFVIFIIIISIHFAIKFHYFMFSRTYEYSTQIPKLRLSNTYLSH